MKISREYHDLAVDVASGFGVAFSSLTYPLRGTPREAQARQALMYLLHEVHQLSYTDIGHLLGRYRKTVSHGVEVTRLRMKASRKFREIVSVARYGI